MYFLWGVRFDDNDDVVNMDSYGAQFLVDSTYGRRYLALVALGQPTCYEFILLHIIKGHILNTSM